METEYSNKCPEHDLVCKIIPPTEIDSKKNKLIVYFECPEGHSFVKEFDLK